MPYMDILRNEQLWIIHKIEVEYTFQPDQGISVESVHYGELWGNSIGEYSSFLKMK